MPLPWLLADTNHLIGHGLHHDLESVDTAFVDHHLEHGIENHGLHVDTHHDFFDHNKPTSFAVTHITNSGEQDDTIEFPDNGPVQHASFYHPSSFAWAPDGYVGVPGGYAPPHPPGEGHPYPHVYELREANDDGMIYTDHRQHQLFTAFGIGASTFCGFLGTFSYYVVQEAKKKINDQIEQEASEMEGHQKLKDIFEKAESMKEYQFVESSNVQTFPPISTLKTSTPNKKKGRKLKPRVIRSGASDTGTERSTTSEVDGGEHLADHEFDSKFANTTCSEQEQALDSDDDLDDVRSNSPSVFEVN